MNVLTRRRLTMLLWAIAATGCRDSAGVCAGVGTMPIVVHAKSAATGEQLDGKAVLSITALQAPFESETGPISYDPPSLVLVRFTDQTGSFRVRIEVPGYQAWEQVIDVAPGRCAPRTVTVSASLTPNS